MHLKPHQASLGSFCPTHLSIILIGNVISSSFFVNFEVICIEEPLSPDKGSCIIYNQIPHRQVPGISSWFLIFRDMPVQVDRLIEELNTNPEYNMTHDWKLLTICIGGNDMCAACEDSV